ncbi:MAG: monofunctional biosynthetic peptidoglycan transglycosylase [Rikenellaceae bacterium]|jgi:monofunctional biosynthetic peptidoglycan transglycosylase|nr:monofunctional biosynthetic peptidoglycan transglycosylase [Rikenellaceae bacterium]
MRYLGRLVCYLAIFWFTFSVGSALWLRLVPVTVTPLKVIRLFQNFSGEGFSVKSRWCSLERIDPLMAQAVVATEDNNFLTHGGFDLEAIRRAIDERQRGRRVRGASTISQQTAKNVWCTPDQTWFRKGWEAWYTLLIEILWSKHRIMEVYLNVIETHNNVYGVAATARTFYEKPAERLNAHEASMIATVLPSPRRMNLARPSPYMVNRAAQVRRLMNRLGPVDFDNPPPKPAENLRRR